MSFISRDAVCYNVCTGNNSNHPEPPRKQQQGTLYQNFPSFLRRSTKSPKLGPSKIFPSRCSFRAACIHSPCHPPRSCCKQDADARHFFCCNASRTVLREHCCAWSPLLVQGHWRHVHDDHLHHRGHCCIAPCTTATNLPNALDEGTPMRNADREGTTCLFNPCMPPVSSRTTLTISLFLAISSKNDTECTPSHCLMNLEHRNTAVAHLLMDA